MKHFKLISTTFCLLFAFSNFSSAQYTNGNAKMGTLWTNYASFGHKSYQGGSNYSLLQSNSGYTILNARSGQHIYFRDGNSGAGNNVNMFINGSSGYVGFATTNPKQRLHVNGGAYINGTMNFYKSNVRQGAVYSNSSQFGLLDKDGNWSMKIDSDDYTSFYVNNRQAMKIYKDDYVDIMDNSSRYLRFTNEGASSGKIIFGKTSSSGKNPKITAWSESMIFGNQNGKANNLFSFKGNILVDRLSGAGGKISCQELWVNGTQITGGSSGGGGEFSRSGYDLSASNVQQLILKARSNSDWASTRLKFEAPRRGKSWEIEALASNSDDKKNELRFWFNNGNPLGFAKLTGDGIFWAKDICVSQNLSDCRDIVFEPDYPLMPLKKVEEFVKTNKHLPEIPSAKEFVSNGQKVGQFTQQLLGKIEELTLYAIDQEKRMDKMEKLIQKQSDLISEMTNK